MTGLPPRSRVEVDLAAIRANVGALARLAGRAEVLAVVKADGYGHGAVPSGRAALDGGATRLCVATLAEALELRAALGPAVPVVVLSPLRPGEEPDAAGLEIVLSSREGFERLRDAGVRCAVHVKVDTGMGRWGLAPDEGLAVGRAIAAGEAPGLSLAGLASHLATADEPDRAFLAEQTRRFREVAAAFPACPRHLANSAATLRAPDALFDAVRTGIAIYGVSPFGTDPAEDGLRPAMRWTSHVAQLRSLAAGGSSGYGRRLVASGPTRVALVPVGYADGYPRLLSGRADVLIGGRRRRVAATVSMDQLTAVVDDDVRAGDEVVLLGRQGDEQVAAEELAMRAETIGWDVVCRVGNRPQRGERIAAG